jgi:ATP-dependent protease ClpP protease subunit
MAKYNEENETMEGKLEPFKGTFKPNEGGVYTFELDDTFEHSSQFYSVINCLDNASEADVIVLRINSAGGSLDAVAPLLLSMRHAECNIHAELVGSVCSAATFVALEADSVSFDEFVSFMVHNVTYGSYGAGHNVLAQVEHVQKLSEKLINHHYKYFLTESEITEVLNGRTMWMDSEELTERFTKRLEAIKALQEDME